MEIEDSGGAVEVMLDTDKEPQLKRERETTLSESLLSLSTQTFPPCLNSVRVYTFTAIQHFACCYMY